MLYFNKKYDKITYRTGQLKPRNRLLPFEGAGIEKWSLEGAGRASAEK